MDEATFHALLQKGEQHRASDVLFKVGQPPAFRIGGELHYLQGDKLRPDHTLRLSEHVLHASRFKGQLDELQQFDTAYSVPGIGRVPSVEDTLTITPPPADSISGTTRFVSM